MSMISEQVKELKEYADGYRKSCFGIDGIVKVLEKAADTIEALSAKLAANSSWISCSERLPECGEGMFLACAENGYIFTAVRSYDGDFRDMYTIGLESFSEDNPIVAWQPLPEPYEVEENEQMD